jgi:hypothetical protein
VGELGLLLGSGLGMFLIFLMVRGSLTDDAYITLDYAKNLALHLHWGLIPQGVANSATSPLNVLLLGTVTAASRLGGGVHPVLALGIVSVGLAMAMAWAWTRVVRALHLPLLVAALGVVQVLVDPFLLSAVGLEVLLVPTLLIVLVAVALEGRPGWFGVVAGLALVARLDLVLFVLAIALGSAAIRGRWRRTLVAALLVAGPWYVFSWLYLGSAVPDTLLIKLSQGGLFGLWSFATGPVMYLLTRPAAVAIAFLPATVGLFVLFAWLLARSSVRAPRGSALPPIGPVTALGVGGVAYYAVYSAIGVGPYHWYYVAPMTALSTFLVIAVGVWLREARERPLLRPMVPAAALAVLGLLALSNAAVDVKQGVPWSSPVIFGNWASAHDYARVGTALRKRVGSATVASPGEIGTLAYFCDCAIVDEFSDRGALMKRVNQKIDAGGPGGILVKLNYLLADRKQRPRRLDYLLQYARGPGSGRDVWQVRSAALGVGHFTLVPVSSRSQ